MKRRGIKNMIRTAIKKRINNKEWMQKAFVEIVETIVMLAVGIPLAYIFKVWIM